MIRRGNCGIVVVLVVVVLDIGAQGFDDDEDDSERHTPFRSIEMSHSARRERSVISRRAFLTGMGLAAIGTGQPLVVRRARGAERASSAPAGARKRVFRESREVFPNPERGFYAPRTTGRMDRLDGLRQQGITLALVEMDLRDFKERDLTPEKLAELRQALRAARQSGLKVLFRAAYGFTG